MCARLLFIGDRDAKAFQIVLEFLVDSEQAIVYSTCDIELRDISLFLN